MGWRPLLNRSRLEFTRRLSRRLATRIVGDIPSTSIRSLPEVLYRDDVARHVHAIRHRDGPFNLHYAFPPHFPPYFRRRKVLDARSAYELHDVCASTATGLCWLPSGRVLLESVGSLRRVLSWGGCMPDLLVKPPRLDVDGPVLLCPSTGYYHWLVEILPAVAYGVEHFPHAMILLPPDRPPYLMRALEMLLGESGIRSRCIEAPRVVRADRLIMPAMHPYSGFVPPTDLDLLRTLSSSRPSTKPTPAKIYVSRRRTPKRRLSNEEDLEQELARAGFSIVHCEHLDLRDQMALFASAELVVGPHGAGLSNIVWGQPACSVVEIFPHQLANDCFARLAVTRGMSYAYSTARADTRSYGAIDIDEVLGLIEAAERA